MTNRTFLTFALSLTLCPALWAQQTPKADQPAAAPAATKPAPDPEVRAAARAAMLAKTGGIIQSPVTGPALLFLNTQTQTPEKTLRDTADTIARVLRLHVEVATRESADPIAEAAKALTGTTTAAVVVIANLPGQPSLLIAPEARWALVNCAPLGGKGVSNELRDERVQKEIWRAFGYLMGAANSNFETCLLKSVVTPADLDALKGKSIGPEPFNKIMTHALKLGMKPVKVTSYRRAIEEGWAPAPTNDVQKAIWNEVKQKAAKQGEAKAAE
jgi:hypothetical protein